MRCLSASSKPHSPANPPTPARPPLTAGLLWGSGFTNGEKTHTPHINLAVKNGIQLTAYHTYKVCSVPPLPPRLALALTSDFSPRPLLLA